LRRDLLVDDLISTGGTLLRAARRCREAGAVRIFAAASHGLFMGQAAAVLADPVFEGIAVADTVRSVAAAEGRLPGNILYLDSSELLADAIMAAMSGGSAPRQISGRLRRRGCRHSTTTRHEMIRFEESLEFLGAAADAGRHRLRAVQVTKSDLKRNLH
jgi:hypothetical protein